MVGRAKLYMLKLVPKLKTNKSLKLLIADMKANSSMLMRLEMARISQKKQKYLIFIVVPHYNDLRLIKPFTKVLEILHGHFIDYAFCNEKVNSPSTQYDFD